MSLLILSVCARFSSADFHVICQVVSDVEYLNHMKCEHNADLLNAIQLLLVFDAEAKIDFKPMVF